VCVDTTASSFVTKVQVEVFEHFRVVAIKVAVVCGIECLSCLEIFFMKNPPDAKENDEHALDFACHLSCLFQSQ
jgi:hypothetical protein